MKPNPPISLKAWKMNTAERLGISVGAVKNRLWRGIIPCPKVKRLNKRTILVLEEA